MDNKKLADSCLDTYEKKQTDDARNRLLLSWIKDDDDRGRLFDAINRDAGGLVFPSRDSGQREGDVIGLGLPRPATVFDHRPVRLVTRRAEIEEILANKEGKYSSRVYAELGGGSFMLALDPKAPDPNQPPDAHEAQRKAYHECFPRDPGLIQQLSRSACQAASIMSLRAAEFDLATFAEQSAVRFCQKLLGYAFSDYPLLERSLRAAYRGLVYQVMGRHFVSDPVAIPAAKMAMGQLLKRTGELIDAYESGDEDVLKGCKDLDRPSGIQPVMEKLGKADLALNGEQRAVLAVGAAVGTVGNVQAAACIAVKALFADDQLFEAARALARSEPAYADTRKFKEWHAILWPLLAANPPIPFLPRLEVDRDGKRTGEVLLALGGGTRDGGQRSTEDPLIWGMPGSAPHWCAGQALAWPLVVEIVRQVMRLPGLAERLDPEDASVMGLEKRWGFACESYPLTHQRERRIAQSSLNVAMRLKAPVRDNADRVREVIRSGAPRIEQALRESRHVHFAWFELIESDTVLVLHTVYDGPFWAYIQHFALKVGDLFDSLFECIEDPPPMPVDKFPNEFVAHIQKYDRKPAMGYFFTAYPRSDVARILRDELARP